MIVTRELRLPTQGHTDVQEITALVQDAVAESGLATGIATDRLPGLRYPAQIATVGRADHGGIKEKAAHEGGFADRWRRGRDLNPRSLAGYTISNRAH